ncbi:hypothetical protein BTR14_08975 [Rhizobium rhizosphaerae]|uniref:Carbohydrate kinase PfkB domain-containing protein n=1 Tax=Xaviernesmea rhizosphaerae TaxID=1672749 RepID=A0ABX3PE83_9HYPH|nr:PfkB family carbohydrate kinase [Xaviernesmea rhizosphaerae]OQP86579.1 hypothetical protein BTR14_08975 [Xaviernesmea rhizosphaerae]
MPMPRPTPLVVLGNLNIDLILGPTDWPEMGTEVFVEHDELRIGGSAGNTALALQGIGHPHILVGSVGTDVFGAMIEAAFAADARRLARSTARTTLTVGITHPGSERTFFTTRGHLPQFSAGEALSLLDGVDLEGGTVLLAGAFQTERLLAGYDELIAALTARGARIAVDPGWPTEGYTPTVTAFLRDLLTKSHCVLFNETEALHLAPAESTAAAARILHALQPEGAETVVKCGGDGALVIDAAGTLHHVPAPIVDIIDTIGAGDVFNAGYLSGRSLGQSPIQSLARATMLASRAISTLPRVYA